MSYTAKVTPGEGRAAGDVASREFKTSPARFPVRPAIRKKENLPRHIRNLFSDWKTISGLVRAAKRVALFLDFDGTLAPFCERPELVQVDRELRAILSRLAGHPKMSVFVVTGRRRADVKERLGVPGIRYVGLFGWEDRPESSLTPAAQSNLLEVKERLARRLRKLRGVWIEDKKFSIVVHYRAASPEVALLARRLVREEMRPRAKKLRSMPGNKVREILPREIAGKHRFVRRTLAKFPASALPIYVGDDASDEKAFQELPAGVTIHVGARENTRARYRLKAPGEVRRFLSRLEMEVR